MAKRFWPGKHSFYDNRHIESERGEWIILGHTSGYRASHYSNAIIVAVDGACRGNGRPSARAASAVYLGDGNPHNMVRILDEHDGARTSQRAELWAALGALGVVERLSGEWADVSDDGSGLDRVIVKADSEYVVKGLTEWVRKWRHNGWRNARGRPLVNRDLFERILHQIDVLRGSGVEVMFWLVPWKDNWDADELAYRVLDAW